MEILFKWCGGSIGLNSGFSVRGYVLSHILACSTVFLKDSHLTSFPLFVLAINYLEHKWDDVDSVKWKIDQPASYPKLSNLVLRIHVLKSGSLFRQRKTKPVGRLERDISPSPVKTEDLSVYYLVSCWEICEQLKEFIWWLTRCEFSTWFLKCGD